MFKTNKQLHSYLILQNKDTLVKILSDLYKLDEDNSIKNYNTEELINFILDYFKNNYDL
ncbi:hypothetical protein [Brachyspira hyodysenteriae]|uniref:hypothetical protein n=1 Tax=Brachyspira hyodysenteriae TaxID=159 RepID=UPI0022CDCC1D|nr:hypothetical protein [Brachyspira hyodysenteriae]MDA0087614.1 hypothetical protein [Brachyspira hyodysenteriae]